MRSLFHLISPPEDRPVWLRAAVVAAASALGLWSRILLTPWLGAEVPFIVLPVSVLVSAWYGGFRAGAVATLLGFMGAKALIIDAPGQPFWHFDSRDLLMAALCLSQGLLISALCGLVHHVFARWRLARQQATVDFANMADHSPGFVWSSSADGAENFVNRWWLTFTGSDPRKPHVDRLVKVHPADVERIRSVMADARGSLTPYHVEYRLRRADGVYRWILEHAVPRLNVDGGFEGFIGLGTDITPSHQEREELLFIGDLQSALAASLDLDKTADALVRAVVPALADWCWIQLLDDNNGRLHPLRTHHCDREKVARVHDAEREAEALGDTAPECLARILRDGEPQLVSAVDDNFLRGAATGPAHLTLLRSLGLVSYLAVPLRVRGRIIGVLALATAESGRTLGHDARELVQKIGGIAAFALENARLYQSVRRALAAEERARVASEHSERRFRSAWEADIFGICVVERDGTIRAGNDTFLNLCGYSRADLEAGCPGLRSRVGSREVRFGTFVWEHLAVGGRCEPFEKVVIRPDGREVPFLVGGNVHPDGESCIVFLVDNTARKSAEQALERQRALLKTIIDAVPAMVAYLDPQERFLVHNRQYERWLGLRPEDIHGKTVRDLMGEERYPEAEPHLRAAYAGHNVRFQKHIESSVRTREAMVSYRPDIDASGRVVGVVVHAYDITETRELAAAIERSEKRYRTLITTSAAIVWTAAADGSRLEASGFEDFTGRHLTHDPVARWLDLVHPEDRERVAEHWSRIGDGRRTWESQYRLLACDGRYHHVHSRGAAISADNGSVLEWIGTVTDITLRVEAEQSLRRKEAELKLIIDTMPALVSYVDQSQRYVLANQAYQKWFGLDPESMRGRHLAELLGPEAYATSRERVERALAGEVVRYEDHMPYRHGPPRWVSATLTPHVGEDGHVLGYIALLLDITDRKTAEREIAELLERYRFLADAMPQNVWTANAAGRQDYANQRWSEFTGFSLEDVNLNRWPEIIHPEDLPHTVQRWNDAVVSGGRYEVEHRLRDAHGEYHWFLSLALARRDDLGRVVQWVGTSTNIDAQRRAYVELAEARAALRRHADNLEHEVRLRTARLEEVNAELEAFTYSASHDLRVPLHHVQSFAEAIFEDRNSQLSPESFANLRLVLSSVQRMDRLIIDLLAYSRLSRAEVSLQPIPLQAAVQDVVTEQRATIEQRKARVEIRGELPVVLADRVGLQQALTNLLANALKFTAPGRRPEIVFRAEPSADRVRLWIEDNGIGIDRRHHADIFKLFHRLNGSRDYAGTGIGLSLVKKAVARMGGVCGVESEPGLGSRFWVEFQGTETPRPHLSLASPGEPPRTPAPADAATGA